MDFVATIEGDCIYTPLFPRAAWVRRCSEHVGPTPYLFFTCAAAVTLQPMSTCWLPAAQGVTPAVSGLPLISAQKGMTRNRR